MVQSHRHAVGVVASNHQISAICLNFKTVNSVVKSFKHNMFRILRHNTVHQSAHRDNLGIFFPMIDFVLPNQKHREKT